MRIQKLTHCNVYYENGPFVGCFTEVTVPETKQKTLEHKPGDSIGTRRIPGPMEPLECTLKPDGFYPEFHTLMGDPGREVSLQVRANLKVTENGRTMDIPVRMDLAGWCSSRKVGSLTAADYAKPEYKMEISYFCLVQAGMELECIDIDNCVHRINGVDLLAEFRANLGII